MTSFVIGQIYISSYYSYQNQPHEYMAIGRRLVGGEFLLEDADGVNIEVDSQFFQKVFIEGTPENLHKEMIKWEAHHPELLQQKFVEVFTERTND